MNTIVIEHVSLNDLPAAWRAQLSAKGNLTDLNDTRVTVRIEQETALDATQPAQTTFTHNPLFGMWQDRVEAANVADYARTLRAPRY